MTIKQVLALTLCVGFILGMFRAIGPDVTLNYEAFSLGWKHMVRMDYTNELRKTNHPEWIILHDIYNDNWISWNLGMLSRILLLVSSIIIPIVVLASYWQSLGKRLDNDKKSDKIAEGKDTESEES